MIRSIFLGWLAALALAAPGATQTIAYPPTSAAPAGSNQNLSNTYTLNAGIDGAGHSPLAGGSINVKGNCAEIYTAASDLAGFRLYIGTASSANRYLLDVKGNLTTDLVTNFFVAPGGSTGLREVYFPVRVSSGTKLCVSIQANSTNAPLRVFIEGVAKNATSPPGFSAAVALNADTANTRPSATDIPVNGSSWTTLVDPTAAAYGGFLLSASAGTANPVGALIGTMSLGIGVAGSEVKVAEFPVQVLTSSPTMPQAMSPLYERALSNGVRLSAKATAAASSNADNWRLQVMGLIP